jgi:lipid II:glycine glycyltransferase (peptidoglycan interpeptide bridge formation enzyme)
VEYSSALSDPVWDAFVAGTAGGHHVQTSLWAQVKASLGWQVERVLVTVGGRLVAGCQLLHRALPFAGGLGYVSQGPLLATDNPGLATLMLQALHDRARARRIAYLAVQPPHRAAAVVSCLTTGGFRPSWLQVAPTATVVLDLKPSLEVLLAQMKRQTRQNIRRSEREGLTVREGSAADLPVFLALHRATGRRQKFEPYPERYFGVLWRILQPAGFVRLFMAEYQGQPVSALLVVPFGETVIAKLLGWSGLHGAQRPNEAVFWAAIQWAKTAGYCQFDLEGLDPASARRILNNEPLPEAWKHSPDFFKLGFGGRVELCEAYDYIYNKLARRIYHGLFPGADNGSVLFRAVERFRRRLA